MVIIHVSSIIGTKKVNIYILLFLRLGLIFQIFQMKYEQLSYVKELNIQSGKGSQYC